MEPTNSPTQSETPPASTESRFAGHDIFQDPALAETMKDDPLFLFLKKWWLQVVFVGAAIVLGVYAKGAFEDTYRAEQGRSADLFMELQARFDEIPGLEAALAKALADEAKAGDKKEDAAKKVTAARNALDQSKARVESVLASLADTKKPYSDLAQLYRGALAARSGDVAAASTALSTDSWTKIVDTQSNERFYAELGALVLARAQLDQAASVASARSALRSLAQQGSFFDVAAGLALASASQTAEEKQEARGALELILTRSPEQSEALSAALERLQQ